MFISSPTIAKVKIKYGFTGLMCTTRIHLMVERKLFFIQKFSWKLENQNALVKGRGWQASACVTMWSLHTPLTSLIPLFLAGRAILSFWRHRSLVIEPRHGRLLWAGGGRAETLGQVNCWRGGWCYHWGKSRCPCVARHTNQAGDAEPPHSAGYSLTVFTPNVSSLPLPSPSPSLPLLLWIDWIFHSTSIT